MNDLGANVAVILDDNQAGYSNMKEYVKMNRIEEQIEEKSDAIFDLNSVLKQSPLDQGDQLDLRWGNGLKMDWHYIPKEDQKCHINWRQSINDDGSSMQRLASFPANEANAGYNLTTNGQSGGTSSMQANRSAIESSTVPEISFAKPAGQAMEGKRDDCINLVAGEKMTEIKKNLGNSKFDELTIACVAFVEGTTDYTAVAKKLEDIAAKLGTTNPAVVVSAYKTSPEVFLGRGTDAKTGMGGKPPRFDIPIMKEVGTGGAAGEGGGQIEEKDDPTLKVDWGGIGGWIWATIGKRFVYRAGLCGFSVNDCDFFPKVCYLYCVVQPFCTASRFDDGELTFPFDDTQLASGDIWYTSPFGWRESIGTFHRGIDIGADRGTQIHAVHEGTVTGAGYDCWGEACHSINIDHGNGMYSRYLHCDTVSVQRGQHVQKGQVIGTVGGYGSSGPDTYDDHLHFELCEGDSESTYSEMDPLSFYKKFNIALNSPITQANV